MAKKEDKLFTVLTSIEESLRKQNSPKKIFFQGVLRGFGTAVGATVIFAVVTSLTIYFVDTIDLNSILGSLFNAST